ncbi:MAG: aconitate hydratase 1 [Bdellovibrionales bacterium GWB1_52_6]|nr:MAG: aconitate hydratase 1 [Bdellovibrionales bacterium GWB1_52_6]OFZ02794.1 MAG: aconitate hydratase 1 [Bdellovibrionales bacterium GWA1_52_35]HCM38376.1 aconitate hydratase AcnA [Bdellovibrionales bacterium]
MSEKEASNSVSNSFGTLSELKVGNQTYQYHSLQKLKVEHLPYSLRILLENLLRHEDGVMIRPRDIEALIQWKSKAPPEHEIQFMPARVLLQDFTGVPAVADLAAMRSALKRLGGDPDRINPLQPADLVIDHSIQVDQYGTAGSLGNNSKLEFERNRERYVFLRWGQQAFKNFRVVPPATGICHQVNLEYLGQVAFKKDNWVYPDTLVGTDSHTTMINGLGILGWGVGGIEAEAALLGQPCSMLIPQVVGFRMIGRLQPGTTATDLVLTVTQMLRKKGVVGKFVEFFGPGLSSLTLADRATIGNMAPEYGATCGLFPVDEMTTEFLRLTGRGDNVPLVEAYYKAQGLWFDAKDAGNTPEYSDTLELDLATVEPCLAGPARPQDRVALSDVRGSFRKALVNILGEGLRNLDKDSMASWLTEGGNPVTVAPELANVHPDASLGALGETIPIRQPDGLSYSLVHGSVVIAAITSCTNTSNPAVMIAAGLLARNAVKMGLQTKPWVKTSLAPGSKAVTDYLTDTGLMPYLEALRFHLVGYGCTTCIGNSGALPEHISNAVVDGDLAVASVLSGNRNFEGRINTHVRANYLASPPLVVAYALGGNININLTRDPLGLDANGEPVFLKDIWPEDREIAELIRKHVSAEQFRKSYSDVFKGDEHWLKLAAPEGKLYSWDPASSYIKEPPFFDEIQRTASPVQEVMNARVLALLGDSVTTDHISPAGSFSKNTPAGQYLSSLGIAPKDFNSYGSRRGNHEVMVRGTFANVRIKNRMLPGVEGGLTVHLPQETRMTIYDAAMKYKQERVPLIIVAGKEYGTGSSRDWAAKGPKLLGVRAIIAESFERIHRSNLIGMGILPLQFSPAHDSHSLALTGRETFDIINSEGLKKLQPGQRLIVRVKSTEGLARQFEVITRIDTPNELEYFKNGGILPYVLRQQLK